MAGINVKVLGASLLEKKFLGISERSKTAIDKALDMVAGDLLARAADLSPILTGDLIMSGRVARPRKKGAKVRVVSFARSYALFIHEGKYNLGPLSRRKPATEDGPVGRKFLERPFLRHRERYKTFIADALRKRFRDG